MGCSVVVVGVRGEAIERRRIGNTRRMYACGAATACDGDDGTASARGAALYRVFYATGDDGPVACTRVRAPVRVLIRQPRPEGVRTADFFHATLAAAAGRPYGRHRQRARPVVRRRQTQGDASIRHDAFTKRPLSGAAATAAVRVTHSA